MKYLTLGLALSIFLLFYSIFVGRFPEREKIKSRWDMYGYSVVAAAVLFMLGKILYFSPLAGLFGGILGWHLPKLYAEIKEKKQREKNRETSMDFISVASSMYASNATTPKVMEECAKRLQEPLASEFQNIIGLNKYDKNNTIPDLIVDVAQRYRIPELKAAATIIKRAATGGGARAASDGLMDLSEAIGKSNDRRKERIKSTYDSLLSAKVVLCFLLLGLFLDATVFRSVNQQNPLVVGAGCGLALGYYFLIRRIGRSDDLEEL